MKLFACAFLCLLIINTAYPQVPFVNNYFSGNNICNYFQQTGIFNRQLPPGGGSGAGINWPCGSKDYYIYSSGISLAGKFQDTLAMTTASYWGEWMPGYYNNSAYVTNPDFRIYNVKKNENYSYPDYANWYKMVPYGAPYQDVNGNGIFDSNIDIPGIKDATQTLFLALSDGDISRHTSFEGFGGGITNPLIKADIRMTVWSYNIGFLNDVQFMKFQIIYNNPQELDSARFSFFADPDIWAVLGKHIGCDTLLNLGFGYSGDTVETYGAFGFMILKGFVDKTSNDTVNMTSFMETRNSLGSYLPCLDIPNDPLGAYWMMKGYNNRGNPIYDPTHTPFESTKYFFSGDPETNAGWTPSKGRIIGCSYNGTDTAISPSYPSNCGFVLSVGNDKISCTQGDTQTVYAAQLMAKGNSNKNSVTNLKEIARRTRQIFFQKIVNDIEVVHTPITALPEKFHLYQNYPNPFNPSTKIKFDVPETDNGMQNINIKVFDISGRTIAQLVNESFQPGTYELQWNADNISAGIYFVRLETRGFRSTRKMILLK